MGYGTRVLTLDERDRGELCANCTVEALQRAGKLPAECYKKSDRKPYNPLCETVFIGNKLPENQREPTPYVQRTLIVRFKDKESAQSFKTVIEPYCQTEGIEIGMAADVPAMLKRVADKFCADNNQTLPAWNASDVAAAIPPLHMEQDVVLVHKNQESIEQALTKCQTDMVPSIIEQSAGEGLVKFAGDKQTGDISLSVAWSDALRMWTLSIQGKDASSQALAADFKASLGATPQNQYLGVGLKDNGFITAHSLNKLLTALDAWRQEHGLARLNCPDFSLSR